jgi:hypothetical protein
MGNKERGQNKAICLNVYNMDMKLYEFEKYYLQLFKYYILVILQWIFKHEKLTIIISLLLVGIILYILLSIFAYFILGLNLFLDKIGQHALVELELKTFHYIWENNPWTKQR